MKINKEKIVFKGKIYHQNAYVFIEKLVSLTRGMRTISACILSVYYTHLNADVSTFILVVNLWVIALLIKEKLDRRR